MTGTYGKRQENIYLLYINLEMTGKYDNSLRKHEVDNCQRTGFCKHRGKIGGTARYGKWQNVMASDRKPLNLTRFL